MPGLYPVVAPLHDKEKVEKVIQTYRTKLKCELVLKVPRDGVVLVLVCTGGTERLVLEAARINPNVILLAHKEQNSLPAALEALAALKTMGIPSRIIFGLDDASLAELEAAIKIFEVAETLRNTRIGIFGFPSPWLINLPDFSRAENLFGVRFVHIDLSHVVKEVSQVTSVESLEADMVECTKEDLEKALTLFHAIKNVAEREKLQALGIKCFDLIELMNTTGCLAVSLLNDAGTTAGCEADIPATLTMYILQLLTGNPTFMGNLCSVSEDKVLLAHCTIATSLVETFVFNTHFESGTGVSIQGTFSKGPATLAKLDAAFQKMVLAEGEITESVTLPELCRTQVTLNLTNAKELLKKSLGNHLVLSPGRHK
ncbi:MAG: hypothetical protein AYK19_12000 [Theionarchaea archaeon DG-70-1]|nr:MAG: hypothetical protein AYK19_12000 [Theionarchaea archaeon DG-70-1]